MNSLQMSIDSIRRSQRKQRAEEMIARDVILLRGWLTGFIFGATAVGVTWLIMFLIF